MLEGTNHCGNPSLIDPVMCTGLEVDELCRLEPQVDLLLCTLHGVTAMDDVSVEEDKHCSLKKYTFSNLVLNLQKLG